MTVWSKIKNDPVALEKYRAYQREWRRNWRAVRAKSKPVKPICSPSETQRRWRKNRQRLDRELVFGHYGLSCVRCGEADPVVLTIDHIDQGGARHKPGKRARRISGYQLYRWLVKNGLPDGYRTACYNCQMRFYKEHVDRG